MLKQKTKDIEVGENKYRLTKMDARSGSYVAMKLALLAAPVIKSGSMTEDAMASLVSSLTRKDFDELQTIILTKVQKIIVNGESEAVMPIMKASGEFVDPDLAYDVASVINITVQCIMFNVGDFFNGARLPNLAK